MILTLILCLGIQIMMLAINLIRYYGLNERPTLYLFVFEILVITMIVHTLSEVI